MTETNLAGAVVDTDPDVCTACVLARMLERGVASVAIDSGHASCEGNEERPCGCGCDYSLGAACKDCRRKGTELDDGSRCVNRRDCANALLAYYAEARAARDARAAATPVKRRKAPADPAKRPECRCGCGEKTGGGIYRPGHDARHVSRLAASVKAKELKLKHAVKEVGHSDALVAKLRKAVGR